VKKLLVLLFVYALALAATIELPRPNTLESPSLPNALPTTVAVRLQSAQENRPQQNRGALDEIPCIRDFGLAANDTAERVLGFPTGWAVYCWLDETCETCAPNEPTRVDSLRVRLKRMDGSPADTLDLRIDFCCPADGMNACSGVGFLRDFRTASVIFPADSADSLGQFVTAEIVFEGVLCDSIGSFVGIVSQGTRQGSLVLLAGDAVGVDIQQCEAFVQRDSLEDWTTVWGDPSGPPIEVSYACDLGDSIVVPPCAGVCEFTNFYGLQAYFDPQTNIVYQWLDPGDWFLPLQPRAVDFKLYFEALGSANDTAYMRALFACPGFGDMCCPPEEPLCVMPLRIRRGSAFQTVLDVHADVSDITCCLSEPFWMGLVIDSVTAGAVKPSFLFSSSDVDPHPPLPCEQWTGSAGTLQSQRTDDIGWADISLDALCQNCGGITPEICSPQQQSLDCAGAAAIPCSESGVTLAGLTIGVGNGQARRYCCSDLSFSGPELVFSMAAPNQGNLFVRAATDTLEHVALFLLETCDTRQCVGFGIDSLFATGLIHGDYFIVAERLTDQPITFDLNVVCIADCNHEICRTDVRGPGGIGNRYLDGEGDGAGNTFYQSYYPGTGNSQYILRFNAMNCDSLSPIIWNSQENSPCRMLAFDPRSGGEFWCGTTDNFFTGTGRLYRVSNGGGVIQSWGALPGLSIMRWSGAAFDPTHNHMWVLIRDSSNTGHSRGYEIDLSNPLAPRVIQGPHLLPHQSPNQSLSSAGSDYAHLSNHLLVVHQGMPDDFVQCYEDLNPGYDGPLPGPGLVPVAWCSPDSNSLQGYGIAAIEDSSGGKIAMMNFTDSDWLHPLALYPPPCRITPPYCLPPENLTLAMISGGTRLTWMATYPGVYDIYSSTVPDNDGNPDGGLDPLFTLEESLPLPAGQSQWDDLHGLFDYKIYSIVLTCSTQVAR